MATIDVQVENHGTLFTFAALTPAARAWVEAHVEVPDYARLGVQTFAVEHRFARDLADAMLADGLVVQ